MRETDRGNVSPTSGQSGHEGVTGYETYYTKLEQIGDPQLTCTYPALPLALLVHYRLVWTDRAEITQTIELIKKRLPYLNAECLILLFIMLLLPLDATVPRSTWSWLRGAWASSTMGRYGKHEHLHFLPYAKPLSFVDLCRLRVRGGE